MSKGKKVPIGSSSFGTVDQAPLDRLWRAGVDVTLNPYGRKLSKDELHALLPGAVGLIAGLEPLTRVEKSGGDAVGVAPDELRVWLGLAEEAARRAGEFLVRARVSEVIVTTGLGRDVKLAADRGSEECIIHILREKSDFAILSEECGTVEGRDTHQGLRWIVDPLDGSLNYLKGIPLCCVSVGLWDQDKPLLGVVYDFIHEEMFTGIVGIGAWLNEAPVRVSDVCEQECAVLCTGFPVSTDFSSDAVAGFVRQICQYKKVRLLGSAALSLVYVAAGRMDAYCERDIKLWDVAAGLAIVCGAGGHIVRAVSEKPQALTVYAGNSSLPKPCL